MRVISYQRTGSRARDNAVISAISDEIARQLITPELSGTTSDVDGARWATWVVADHVDLHAVSVVANRWVASVSFDGVESAPNPLIVARAALAGIVEVAS